MTRSSPTRRVTRCVSRYSSSGTANFRESPVSSLNSFTPKRVVRRLQRTNVLDQFLKRRAVDEHPLGDLHHGLFFHHQLQNLPGRCPIQLQIANDFVG